MIEDVVHRPRVNLLIAMAFIVIIACMVATVWIQVTDEFAKATLNLVLGRFLGYVDSIYNYDFGTTRSNTKKDATIAELTKTASTTATTAAIVAGQEPMKVRISEGAGVDTPMKTTEEK